MTWKTIPLMILISVAVPRVFASASDMQTALNILEAQIQRDSEILTAPMNLARAKQTRQKLQDGLGELRRAIDIVKRRYGKTASAITESLEQALRDEEKEAQITRTSNRYRDNLRNTVKTNLEVKRNALAELRKLE